MPGLAFSSMPGPTLISGLSAVEGGGWIVCTPPDRGEKEILRKSISRRDGEASHCPQRNCLDLSVFLAQT